MVLTSVVIVGAGATAVLYYLYRTKTKRVADALAPAYQNMAYDDAEKKSIPSDVVQFVREGLNEKRWKIEAIAYEIQIYFLKKSRHSMKRELHEVIDSKIMHSKGHHKKTVQKPL